MPETSSALRPSPDTTVVTGAAGWLGRALLDRLLHDPSRTHLRLLVHSTAEAAAVGEVAGAHADTRVDVVIGDIAKADTVRRLLNGLGDSTHLLHTAGVIHPKSVKQFYDVNTEGTRQLVAEALDRHIGCMVHVSSNSPFGTNAKPNDTFRAIEPYHPYYGYGKSKMLGERAVLDAVGDGLDATIVRPPWFYGPFQPPRQTTFFRLVRAGRFPVISPGDQRRSMVYVDNLVDGILAAERTASSRGNGYWIADARAYTVNEIVATVGAALRDAGFTVKDPGSPMPAIVGRVAELADRMIQGVGRYQQQFHVLGEMDKTIACDIEASRLELGYEPAVDLAEGMRRSIAWCIEQGLEL